MTNADVVAKKVAFIETCVADFRRTDAALNEDIVRQRFVLHTLQIAIQAAIDIGFHVVSDECASKPLAKREVFLMLGRRNILSTELAKKLSEMAGIQNLIVHRYDELDLLKIRQFLTNDLDDLLSFTAHIRTLLR